MAVHSRSPDDIAIDTTSRLGTGSYGSVFRARIAVLPCAAKLLHPFLFTVTDANGQSSLHRFEVECKLLKSARHPNIVQYLGTYRHPASNVPVLLMELMDECLTDFLENHPRDLPYHTQVNLCYDIALGLAYLHSCNIIHRDLSSNNVLLIAGSRAKVTDFGMARLADATSPGLSSKLTLCPGCVVYMAPEAMSSQSVYEKKLDCFSHGVLTLQILTRKFPMPGNATRQVNDPRYPGAPIQVPVPDKERRKDHIALVDKGHPLLALALSCLEYQEEERPSAEQICHSLSRLKSGKKYKESEEKCKNQKDVDAIIEELRRKDKRIEELILKVQDKEASILDTENNLLRAKQEIEFLKSHISRQTELIESQSHQIQRFQDNKHQLESLSSKQTKVEQLLHQLKSDNSSTQPDSQNTHARATQWKLSDTRLPKGAVRGASTSKGQKAYFAAKGGRQIYEYDTESSSCTLLPHCPATDFGLEVVNGLLTTIGGFQQGKVTDTLCTLVEDRQGRVWRAMYPSMPNSRCHPATAQTDKHLIVAGGETLWWGGEKLDQVDVMCTKDPQWYTTSVLPEPVSFMTATICGNNLYLLGGRNARGDFSNAVFMCSTSSLLDDLNMQMVPAVGSSSGAFGGVITRLKKRGSRSKRANSLEAELWHTFQVPTFASSAHCNGTNGQLLAIGGCDSNEEPLATIYAYDDRKGSWRIAGSLLEQRAFCFTAALADNRVAIAGGYSGKGVSTMSGTIEFGTLNAIL